MPYSWTKGYDTTAEEKMILASAARRDALHWNEIRFTILRDRPRNEALRQEIGDTLDKGRGVLRYALKSGRPIPYDSIPNGNGLDVTLPRSIIIRNKNNKTWCLNE